MAFSERFIEEVKSRADIVDVISSYLPLTRAGSNYKALCPFHREKTPSFFVSPHKQIYHCFGCGKGGNVFSFIMEYEKVSFPEAVEIVARRYNIPIPQQKRSRDKGYGPSVKSLWALNTLALKFYHRFLFTKEGKPALDYLFSRGLSLETIKKFYLGYAPGRGEFLEFARNKGATDELLVSSGLAIKSERGVCYERFRDRVLFPVFNLQGRVVGFGGRVINPEHEPKYLNSPDTPVFKKSNLLYGLHLARRFTEEGIIVVEGYMDLLALHQAGIKNVVATLGTSLTEDHLRLLQRFTNKVLFLFDPDPAGIKATMRAVRLSLPLEISVKVLTLPGELDPDEFIREYGVNEFYRLVGEARDGAEFLFDELLSKYDLDDPKQKSLALNELFDLLKDVDNSIIQSGYITLLSRKLQVSASVISREFVKIRSRSTRPRQKDEEIFIEREVFPTGVEMELLKIALCYPEFVPVISEVLLPTDFEDADLAMIWEVVQEGLKLDEIVLKIQEGKILVREAIYSWLNSLAFLGVNEITDIEGFLTDAVRALEEKRRRKRIRLLRQAIKEREEQGLDCSELLGELNEILRYKGGM